MASVRVATHPHARFLFQPPLQTRRLVLFIVSYFFFYMANYWCILYNIYINIRVSDKVFILSRPPTYINELRKKPPCTSLQRVEKLFSNIKNILEPSKDITLDWVVPCITAGPYDSYDFYYDNKLINSNSLTMNRIIREELS